MKKCFVSMLFCGAVLAGLFAAANPADAGGSYSYDAIFPLVETSAVIPAKTAQYAVEEFPIGSGADGAAAPEGVVDDYGDDCASAAALAVNSVAVGTVDFGGDFDVFAVTMPTSGALSAATSGMTDTVGYLSDAACASALFSDDDSGLGRNFRIEGILPAGTYYIGVGGFDGQTLGDYVLHVSTTSGAIVPGGFPVDIYTNKGGFGRGASGGSYFFDETASLYVQMGQSGSFALSVYRSDGTTTFHEMRDAEAGTYRYDVEAERVSGVRTVKVEAWGDGGYGSDTLNISLGGTEVNSIAGVGLGGDLQIDLFTDRGAVGLDTDGGEYKVEEIIWYYVWANKDCSYTITVREPLGVTYPLGVGVIGAGQTANHNPRAKEPVGLRTVILEAWTADEYQQDYCLVDVYR